MVTMALIAVIDGNLGAKPALFRDYNGKEYLELPPNGRRVVVCGGIGLPVVTDNVVAVC